jgi:putative ABC transport system permease protein
MTRLLRRLTYLFQQDRADADLQEEIEVHRSMKQDDLVRSGMSVREADRASRKALGNIMLAREDARATWIASWVDDLWQDTAYALRSLKRAPGFAAALIVVTALGIGATNSVFGLIDSLVLRPLPVREPHRLASVGQPSFSFPLYRAIRDRGTNIFSDVFAWNIELANVNWTDEIEPSEILLATGNFYSTLGIPPAIGRLFDAQDDRFGGGAGGPVAVISYACWQRRFGGDPSVIGRTVRIQGQVFTIVGVTPRGFFGVASGLAPEVTIPMSAGPDRDALTRPSIARFHIMGRLREGSSLQQGDAALQQIRTAVLEVTTTPDAPADRRAKFLSRGLTLKSAETGFSRVRQQFAEPLWLLLALVGLLFAVACATAANLLLARAVGRQRELAIRLAIGAGRGRLLRQFFTESLVWATLAGALSMVVGSWTSGALISMMTTRAEPIVLDVDPSWRVTLFTLALTLLTVLVCSLVSAVRATRVAPREALVEIGQAGGAMLRRWSFGKILVTLQVALTMMLLVGATLFVRSLSAVLSQNAGFDRDNLLVVATDPSVAGYKGDRVDRYYAELRERIAAIPGVASTSLSVVPPISNEDGNWTQSIAVDGSPMGPESGRYVYFNAVSPGYFSTLGIRVRQGRDFSDGDTAAGTRVVIVSEALAQTFFPGVDPVGRLISIGRAAARKDLQIVGVVANSKYQTLQEETRRIAYLPATQHASGGTLILEVRPHGRGSSLMETVRREARALDGGVPVRIETVTDRIRESLVKERVMAVLASGMGVAALLLACAGLYGLLAYAVSRQRGEMGIRLALGAARSSVLWLVLRQCFAMVAIGSTVGIAASFALERFARTLLYQVSATDIWSVAISSAIMLAVAASAGFLPARRAASVDPVIALRGD